MKKIIYLAPLALLGIGVKTSANQVPTHISNTLRVYEEQETNNQSQLASQPIGRVKEATHISRLDSGLVDKGSSVINKKASQVMKINRPALPNGQNQSAIKVGQARQAVHISHLDIGAISNAKDGSNVNKANDQNTYISYFDTRLVDTESPSSKIKQTGTIKKSQTMLINQSKITPVEQDLSVNKITTGKSVTISNPRDNVINVHYVDEATGKMLTNIPTSTIDVTSGSGHYQVPSNYQLSHAEGYTITKNAPSVNDLKDILVNETYYVECNIYRGMDSDMGPSGTLANGNLKGSVLLTLGFTLDDLYKINQEALAGMEAPSGMKAVGTYHYMIYKDPTFSDPLSPKDTNTNLWDFSNIPKAEKLFQNVANYAQANEDGKTLYYNMFDSGEQPGEISVITDDATGKFAEAAKSFYVFKDTSGNVVSYNDNNISVALTHDTKNVDPAHSGLSNDATNNVFVINNGAKRQINSQSRHFGASGILDLVTNKITRQGDWQLFSKSNFDQTNINNDLIGYGNAIHSNLTFLAL